MRTQCTHEIMTIIHHVSRNNELYFLIAKVLCFIGLKLYSAELEVIRPVYHSL